MGFTTILKASAGSGKTYRLVGEYIHAVVAEPMLYRHILAVTFTNKATEELKGRIVAQLHALASGSESPYMAELTDALRLTPERIRANAQQARHNILHDYSHFAVLTIDKFFQNIIRAFLREIGINPDFRLELRTDSLLDQAADQLIELTATDPSLRSWVEGFVEEQLDSSASWDVRRKLAEAGNELFGEAWDLERASGEESIREPLAEISRRIEAMCEQAVGQMRSTAAQALEAMERAGLTIDDFAYKSSGVAGYIYKVAQGETAPYGARARSALEKDQAWGRSSAVQALVPTLRPILQQLCALWDEHHRLIHSASIVRRRLRTFGLLHDLSRIVGTLSHQQNVMPIARTNRILQHLVADNDAPFIFEKAGNHFSRFLIDEFQDTSRVQWENFVPLLAGALAQSAHSPVMLVGDVKQSIYRWRGGDWRLLAHTAAETLGEVRQERLNINRRSRPQIVAFNNAVMARVVESGQIALMAQLDRAREGGYLTADHAARLEAMLPEAYADCEQTPAPEKTGGYVTLTQTSERSAIIERIEELLARGYLPSQIAILVRRNDQAREMAALLLGSGHEVVTSEALQIGSSREVEAIVACLRLSIDPSDRIARALWNRRHGHSLHEPLPAQQADFIASLATCSPQEAFHRIVMRYGIDPEQIAYAQALDEQIVRYGQTNVSDTALFLQWWDERGRTENIYMPQSRSAIGIFTIHAAKGLERPAIILPDCSWPLDPKSGSTLWVDAAGTPFEAIGQLPIGIVKDAAQSWFAADYYDELVAAHIDNINLLYVALTRARDELHIFLPDPLKNGDTGGLLLAAAGEQRIFGKPVGQAPVPQDEGRIQVGYPIHDPGLKIRRRLPASRYADQGVDPRSRGVMMHRLFEQARTQADLSAALLALRQDGLLSAEREGELVESIERAMGNELIASWFSGRWSEVRNEADILLPAGAGMRRPDRVIAREGEAVVVDYKFGENVETSHRRQVEEYMKLLERMGYREVKGYIWYISREEVVAVIRN